MGGVGGGCLEWVMDWSGQWFGSGNGLEGVMV